jgi:iron complex outermembrane receptor protein
MRIGLIGWVGILGIACLLASAPAFAEEEQENVEKIGEVVVTGEKLVTPTKQTDETVYTGDEITKKGIEIQGGAAATSVYEAMDILPGVSVESADPLGLAAEQRYIRVRGVRGYLGAMSVEGIPNWGGNPIGPREYIYDMENFQSVSVYKGATPSDLATGVGSRGGAIELKALWPEDELGFNASQAFGSNNYSRTFVRGDSGALPVIGSKVSLSYSYTDAEKWKGPGDLGPRNNVNFMFAQPVTEKDEIKFWVNHNEVKQNLYNSLSYSETRDLDDNYDKDYNRELTGVRSKDIYYYNYNKADLKNTDLFGILPISLTEAFRLSFKPYYSNEDSEILNGSTSQGGLVQKRTRDVDKFGIISEASYDFSFLKASVGYWFESVDMKILSQNYVPGSMKYQGYGIYTENEDDGLLHSPYVKLSGSIADFDWQAGLKYFYYRDPATKGYLSTAPTYGLTHMDDLDRSEKEYDAWLPTAGIAYNFTDSFQLHANYGRSQSRPYSYVPLINIYNSNRSAFQKAGVTMNDLFNGYDMEISDNFEIGARYRMDWLEVMPTVFYSKHDKLLTTVYDPRVNLSYQQNIGKATGVGAELETNIYLGEYLTFFFNPTYTDLTYDDDLTYQGSTLDTEGKQVVDTPEWLIKSGVVLKYKGLEIVPMVRYMGERYGDAEHKEKVGDYFLADLKIDYTFTNAPLLKSIKTSLEFYNLFDKKYISSITSSDDTRAGSTSYYAGAPFTMLGKVSFDF